MSTDGGKTVNTAAASKIHSDHHAIWINPANSNHVLIGNDGGLAVSWDQAKTWNFLPNLPVGLFYHVERRHGDAVQHLRRHAGQLQLVRPERRARHRRHRRLHTGRRCRAATGSSSLQDPTDFRIAYSESQDGNMVRIDRVTGETMSIRPQANPGEPPLRWNWDTPLVMSPHDPKIIFAAGNKVFRSSNRGLNWEAVGADLTSNANREEIVTMGVKGSDIRIAKNDGIQAWPTIISFAESAKRTGVIYAGTDDGIVQVTRDGGRSWTNVTDKIPGLPKGIWVSEVVPSRFDEGDGVRDVRRPSPERLRDLHLRRAGTSAQTWQSAAGEPEGRSREDADRRPEEPGRALPRHRDRPVRVDRSRRRAGRASRRTCRRSASTRSRCTRATTR